MDEARQERTVPMTPGREPWGHQRVEDIPASQVAAYRKRGWRVYDPGWENRPPEVFNPLWWLEAIGRKFFG